MTRIPLADEDIIVGLTDPESHRITNYVIEIEKNEGDEWTHQELEQLKKQILDDYEFSNSFDVKLDKDGNIISIPIKELKEKAEKYDGLVKEYGEFLKRNEKNKEIVQKVRERMKSTKAINPLWYDIKEILKE